MVGRWSWCVECSSRQSGGYREERGQEGTVTNPPEDMMIVVLD